MKIAKLLLFTYSVSNVYAETVADCDANEKLNADGDTCEACPEY